MAEEEDGIPSDKADALWEDLFQCKDSWIVQMRIHAANEQNA